MSTVSEKLHKWCLEELSFVQTGFGKVPDSLMLKSLTKDKNRRIWNYVINHVKSEYYVNKVKSTLYIKKLLKEKNDDAMFQEFSTETTKLQTAITKATEKMTFLKQTLSTIEEKILNLEELIEKLSNETFQIKQKSAIFEHYEKKICKKNDSLKILKSHISSSVNALYAYQSSLNICNQSSFSRPYEFLVDCKSSNEIEILLGDIINAISSVIKSSCMKKNENNKMLLEIIQKKNVVLKEKKFLLTDLVFLLKCMSDSSMQDFTNIILHSASINNFMSTSKEKYLGKQILAEIKYDVINLSLFSKRNKLEQFQDIKTQIFKDKIQNLKNFNDFDFDIEYTLAENEALVKSNEYLEENIQTISNRAETMKQNNDLVQNEFNILMQVFNKNADLMFYLLYSATDTFKKVPSTLSHLQFLIRNESFKSQTFLSDELVNEIKASLASDKKLMHKYCETCSFFKSLPSAPCKINNSSSHQIKKSLIIEPFENISVICKNWINFKQNLQIDAVIQSHPYEYDNNISVTEKYTKIIQLLDKIKTYIEDGVFFANDGMAKYNEIKTVLQDWWEQNAQFIPDMEYEGKTLKMWIDILNVLTDFEPTNYSA